MKRGDVVTNKDGEFYIFLSESGQEANCAVIEDVMDIYQGETVAKCTGLKKIPLEGLTVAEDYPRFYNQINFS